MEFIAHRVNTIADLKQLPEEYGVELDLRDYGENIILQHDPFKMGDDFAEYLKYYNHGTMILNVKSERIEHRVLELLQKHGIKKYFFLDSTFPMIYLLASQGEKNIAIRFSEFEGLDTILNMKGKVGWVWVDCFTRLPIDHQIYKTLNDNGFKMCLVSPELQQQGDRIEEFAERLRKQNIIFDAICTKFVNVSRWKNRLAGC